MRGSLPDAPCHEYFELYTRHVISHCQEHPTVGSLLLLLKTPGSRLHRHSVLHDAGDQTALAASSHAGLVAAGFERLQRHRRSSDGILAIWQPLPEALISAASPSPGAAHDNPSGKARTQDDDDSKAAPGCAEVAASSWQMALVAELPTSGVATAICWLDRLQAAAPAIAVAQGSASLTIFAQHPR